MKQPFGRRGLILVGVVIVVLGAVFILHERSATFNRSPEVKATVAGNTAFAIDLYQKAKTQPGNVFFSPYSISTTLTMAYAGARNQTATEMSNVLHISVPPEQLHSAYDSLSKWMKQLQSRNQITLLSANSLWCQADAPLSRTFVDVINTHFDGEVRQVDFKHSAMAVSAEMNGWVEQKTMGKIKGSVGAGQISADTQVVLCNAIYFKGKWKSQFKKENTTRSAFFVTTNESVMVPTMSQVADFKMVDIDGGSVQILELPYVGGNIAMVILLPTPLPDKPGFERFGLTDLESELTPSRLEGWLDQLDKAGAYELAVNLPRFTTTQSLELTSDLKSMGMPSAFRRDADFSGMATNAGLLISEVFHKAFVEVNEEGTEAAAATWESQAASAVRMFNADHPFIFLIRDKGSGAILFLGRVVDPTK